REALAPIGRGHLGKRVAIVAGGVVDQDLDRPQRRADTAHRRLKRCDVAQIGRLEMHPLAQLIRQRDAGRAVEIEEAHFGALLREVADDGRTDPRGAASNQSHLIGKARISRDCPAHAPPPYSIAMWAPSAGRRGRRSSSSSGIASTVTTIMNSKLSI